MFSRYIYKNFGALKRFILVFSTIILFGFIFFSDVSFASQPLEVTDVIRVNLIESTLLTMKAQHPSVDFSSLSVDNLLFLTQPFNTESDLILFLNNYFQDFISKQKSPSLALQLMILIVPVVLFVAYVSLSGDVSGGADSSISTNSSLVLSPEKESILEDSLIDLENAMKARGDLYTPGNTDKVLAKALADLDDIPIIQLDMDLAETVRYSPLEPDFFFVSDFFFLFFIIFVLFIILNLTELKKYISKLFFNFLIFFNNKLQFILSIFVFLSFTMSSVRKYLYNIVDPSLRSVVFAFSAFFFLLFFCHLFHNELILFIIVLVFLLVIIKYKVDFSPNFYFFLFSNISNICLALVYAFYFIFLNGVFFLYIFDFFLLLFSLFLLNRKYLNLIIFSKIFWLFILSIIISFYSVASAVEPGKPFDIDGEGKIVPIIADKFPVSYDAWKESLDIIYHSKTSDAEALAAFKKNKLGLLYGSYGNEGASIKNEVHLANIIAAQLADSFTVLPSKFISPTQNIFFEGSQVFTESFLNSDSFLLKNKIQPFICKVLNANGFIDWSLVYPDFYKGDLIIKKFEKVEDIIILNNMSFNSGKFIIISRNISSDLNLPLAQQAIGDLLILDSKGNVISMLDLKNLSKEESLPRYFNHQKNVDFYAHFKKNNLLFETFVDKDRLMYLNKEFKDHNLITSPMAYKQLIQAKANVIHNMPNIASSILKLLK